MSRNAAARLSRGNSLIGPTEVGVEFRRMLEYRGILDRFTTGNPLNLADAFGDEATLLLPKTLPKQVPMLADLCRLMAAGAGLTD